MNRAFFWLSAPPLPLLIFIYSPTPENSQNVVVRHRRIGQLIDNYIRKKERKPTIHRKQTPPYLKGCLKQTSKKATVLPFASSQLWESSFICLKALPQNPQFLEGSLHQLLPHHPLLALRSKIFSFLFKFERNDEVRIAGKSSNTNPREINQRLLVGMCRSRLVGDTNSSLTKKVKRCAHVNSYLDGTHTQRKLIYSIAWSGTFIVHHPGFIFMLTSFI